MAEFNVQSIPIIITNQKCVAVRNWVQQLITLTALCLGYCIYGWMINYTSPTEKELLNIGIFNTLTFSIFSSLTLFGVSSLIVSPFAKKWSCKCILLVSTLFGGAGWLLIIVANDMYSMIVGRLLTGLHVGTCMALSMIYMGEIFDEKQVKVYAAFILLPSNIAFIFLYLFAIVLSFQWLCVVVMIALLIQAILLLFCPQSPTWLVYVGLDSKARETLHTIHGEAFDAEGEVDRIKSKLNDFNTQSTVSSIRGLIRWKTLRPILIVCTLQAFKACSGQPVYYSYAASLFSKSSINSNIAALPFPILLTVGCLISLLLANRVSRKKLLIGSTAMQAVANFSLFLHFLLDERIEECSNTFASISCAMLSIWPILSISVYSLFYTIGWGTISWTIYANCFDHNYKEISAGIVTLFYSLVQTTVVLIFPNFIELFSEWSYFLITGFVCLIAVCFEYFAF